MLLPIKAICDRRTKKDGTNAIAIQYCYSPERRTVLPINIYVPIRYWNRKQRSISEKLPVSFGDAYELNQHLLKWIRRAEDIVSLAKKLKLRDPILFLKQHFYSQLSIDEVEEKVRYIQNKETELKPPDNLDLYFQIDDYINSKVKKVCKDMPRIYRNMKYHLQEFEQFRGTAITFDCLDFDFYEKFVDFLMNDYIQKRRKKCIKGLKTNTVGKTIKQFSTFLRNRIRKRIIPPIDMDGWTILEEEVDVVYLPWDQINSIYQADLSKYPHLEEYRDHFVLGCFTGLRFSDFSRLMQEDIKGDMLFKKQQKSNHWVVIPLKPTAQEILDKRFKNEIQYHSNPEFNRHIKTIAKLAGITEKVKFSHKKSNKLIVEIKPKYEWITTHTCRRSFCTNEFLAGTLLNLL